jgi:diketogulonate reductase-like aldo/keto reductase
MRDIAAGRTHVPKSVPFKPPVLLTAPLRTGATIPLLGLGTWKSKPGEVHDAVLYAITQAGYRHIDCAAIYEVRRLLACAHASAPSGVRAFRPPSRARALLLSQNEGEVGAALKEVFSKWAIVREEVFITSKLWNNDHATGAVEPAVRKCLALLGLDYLDAFLIHWPITGSRGDVLTPSTHETWQAMEALVAKGLVKHIGVSNFSVRKMQEIMSYAKVPISVSQNEAHPYFRNDSIVRFCNDSGIHFTAFSPLGSPDSADIFKRTSKPLMDDPLVHELAAKHNKNIGQVLIKWALQQRPQSSVLPKSVSPARILGNAAVLDWELAPEDVAGLSACATQCRSVHGGVFLSPAGPYRTLKDLWDEEE